MANFFTGLLGTLGRTLMCWSGSGSGIGGRYRTYLPGTRIDYEAEAGDLWQHSAVAACLAWITANGTEPPLHVVAGDGQGGEAPVPDHPATALLARPNPAYDWPTVMAGLLVDLACDGNAYLRIVRTNLDDPAQLWYVPSWAMAPLWPFDGSEFINGYEYAIESGNYFLPVDETIHIRRGIDPRNERLGLSPLKAQLREIVGDSALSTMQAAIARNLGVPTWLLAPEGDESTFSDESATRIKEWFVARSSGDEAGKPLAVSDPLKATRLGFSPDEMRANELRKVPESRICAALCVPPQVIGLIASEGSKTYANYAEARSAAYDDCLEPTWALIARALSHQLLERDYAPPAGTRLCFDTSRVKALQPDRLEVLEEATKGYAGGLMSLNEARGKIGLPEKPDGEVILVPRGYTTLEATVDPEPVPGPTPSNDPPDDEGDDPPTKAARDGHAGGMLWRM